jgi:splicing factor 3A subunit 3
MDSVIEVQRQTHEEVERYERALYTLLSQNHNTHEAKLQTEHKASQILDRLTARTVALSASYKDEETRKAEVALLSAPGGDQNDLGEFYARLVKVQDHYRKYPDSVAGGFESELAAFLDEPEQDVDDDAEYEDREYFLHASMGLLMMVCSAVALLFSGEEGYGKYLDLYSSHTMYNNLKNVGRRLGYLQYMDALLTVSNGALHKELSQEVKTSRDYETLVDKLHDFLTLDT